jgi:predicted dehydrogenase
MINVGVIGVGYLGYHHTRIIKSLDNVKLVGVVDINPDRAKEVGEEFNVPYYTDYNDLVGKVDSFIIATPTITHYNIAKNLILKGKNILIEKPVAAKLEEAHKLLELSNNTDKIITVGHIERFNPALKAFKQHIEYPFYFITERLGRFSNRALDVDVVKDLMIHDIDIVFSLAKAKDTEIRAVGIPVVTKSIDIANVIIEFEDGSVANLTASRVSAEKVRKIRIFQKNSYFNLDYTIQEVFVTKVFKNDIRRTPIEVDKGEPLKLELINFFDSIERKAEQEVTLKEGVMALEIAEKILELINVRTKQLLKSEN